MIITYKLNLNLYRFTLSQQTGQEGRADLQFLHKLKEAERDRPDQRRHRKWSGQTGRGSNTPLKYLLVLDVCVSWTSSTSCNHSLFSGLLFCIFAFDYLDVDGGFTVYL